ncbi:hypothetical protein CDAR_609661 [Caerostris darwini]|uniref:C2H2-type domain-containing protein n=1 Tax=Caerostris darwini TaxID=1538125 RepID=A0AAV4R640_9ARAC|nr:hypothetical protein CDAR_609661 [Caerostris darwini]
MVIRNCEFCNAHVADFEVHICRIFGKQHRQSSATLPGSSSGSLPEDIDLRTEQIHYEERIPSIVQTHASGQHSIFPNIRKNTDCEETEAAEVSSQHGVANQKPHNPEISDFRFPGKPRGEEIQTKSTYLLQPSEDNSAIVDQNPQFCEAWNPNPNVNTPLPIAEPCILPGFQQTFGQRNTAMNLFTQYPNASSQMQCSGIHHMDEMSSHFESNESDNVSINQLTQYYDTSLGIPTLAVQNTQYNPMDPITPTDAVGPIQSNICRKEFVPKDHLEPLDRSRSPARRYSCSYCDKKFSTNGRLTIHIRTHTGEKPYKCVVCNQSFTQNSDLTKHMRIHNRRTLHKCTECSESFVFRSRLEEHFSRVHPGKNLYKCEQCGNVLADSHTLRSHIRNFHTDDKPYKCTECGKCYAVHSRLKRHMLLHTKV